MSLLCDKGLSLLGLPPEWHEQAFLNFCAAVDHPSPSHEDMGFLAAMFRATEQRYGGASEDLDGFTPQTSLAEIVKLGLSTA